MLPATKPNVTPQRSRIRDICADAAALGVERTHLFRVLTGQRSSKRLLARYQALKRGKG